MKAVSGANCYALDRRGFKEVGAFSHPLPAANFLSGDSAALLPLNIMKVALGEQCLGGRSGMLIGRAAFSKKPPIPGQLHLSVWNPQPHSMENRKGRPSLI